MKKFRLPIVISVLLLSALACSTTLPFDNLFSTPSSESAVEVVDSLPTLENTISSVSVSSDLISQQDALISLYEIVSPGVVSIFAASPPGIGPGLWLCD